LLSDLIQDIFAPGDELKPVNSISLKKDFDYLYNKIKID